MIINASKAGMKRTFEILKPDFEISPLTGMTKQHYIEMAKYLLERAFTHVNDINQPISFPVVPGET